METICAQERLRSFSNVMKEVVKAAEAGKPVLVSAMDFKFYLKQDCCQGRCDEMKA